MISLFFILFSVLKTFTTQPYASFNHENDRTVSSFDDVHNHPLVYVTGMKIWSRVWCPVYKVIAIGGKLFLPVVEMLYQC